MNIRRFLFLSLGLNSALPPEFPQRAYGADKKLTEPQGSRVCRRNIVVLSGVLFLAGLAGADLQSLNLFGIQPPGDRGVLVLGIAAVIAQCYWYVLRYQHLSEDGTIERDPDPEYTEPLKISENEAAHYELVRKKADLFSNWAAFVMTLLSWWFIASWII